MRIFIAVDLPKEVKNYLYDLQKELQVEKKYNKINWIAKKNLHLTLRFLGDITKEELSKVEEELERIRLNKFEAILKGTGIFPNEIIPRIVWVGLEPKEGIQKLQHKVDELTLGIGKAEQEFSAHITLGRIKKLEKKKELLEKIKELKIKELKWKIEKITIFESVLSKEGPKYKIIKEIVLQ